MNQKTFAFSAESETTEQKILKEPKSARLSVVADVARVLSKEQRRFNKLLARIENLRSERADLQNVLDAALAEYIRRIHPVNREIHEARRMLLRVLARLYAKPQMLR